MKCINSIIYHQLVQIPIHLVGHGIIIIEIQIKVTGFPQSVNNNLVNTKTSHSQYTGTGNLQDLTDYKLFHDADTSGGNSGGPVYIEETINNNKCYTVLAIHTCGEDGNDNDNSENNSGTRITTDIMKFYMSNSNIGY